MSGSGSGERRAFYRLRYPVLDRPRLLTDNIELDVAEISESGLRVWLGHFRLEPDRPMTGWVRFFDSYSARVEGTVLRIEDDEAIVQLSIGVPLKRMLAEQRRLIQLYPMLFERGDSDLESGA